MAEGIAIARDVAIILVAILDIVLLLILAVIAYLALKLFLKVKAALPDVIDTSKSTLTTVQGTTDFVVETAVTPLIRFVAVASAISRFVAVLFGGQRRRV